MASTKVKGIVLGGVDIKEKDKLVTLYTLERGKMTVSLRGVRAEKAKLKAAKEIFCFGDFIIEEGKTNIVTAVDVIDNFYDLTSDIEKYYEGCTILDIVSKVSISESNPPLFIELVKALKTLCYDSVKKNYVLIKFLLSVFKALGYQFLTDYCSSCGSLLKIRYFNFKYGELLCPACKDSNSVLLSENCYSALKIIELSDYEKLKNVNLKGRGDAEALDLLKKNFELRTGYSCLKSEI